MTNYRVNREPSAIVLVKNQRSGSLDEPKNYSNNQIFLDDKQQFLFKIFNPLSEKIGVSFKINGNSDNSILVLNPGEEILIERFLDTNRKMVFETYKINSNNSQAKEAIEDNGVIEFSFFKEKVKYIKSFNSGVKSKGYDNNLLYSSTVNTFFDANVNCTYTSGLGDFNSTLTTASFKNIEEENDNKIETGRIEKGDVSNQNFVNVNVDFDNKSFYSISYKLLPMSAKSEQSFKVRNYCTQCGRRIKETFIYCPLCGAKIE